MRMTSSWRAAIAALAFFCSSGAWAADALPDYAFYNDGRASAGSADSGLYQATSGSSFSLSESYYGTTAQVDNEGTVSPSPSISSLSKAAIATNTISASAYGSQSLQYSFEISGPTNEAAVLVQASGLAALTDNSGGRMSGHADVSLLITPQSNASYDPSLYVLDDSVAVDLTNLAGLSGISGYGNFSGTGTTGSVSEDQVYMFQTNTVYDVLMEATTDSYGVYNVATQAGDSMTTSAMVDPVFTPLSNLYTIDFSNGIGNASAASGAPEPDTWALMILGLGAAGGVLRRRHREAQLAVA